MSGILYGTLYQLLAALTCASNPSILRVNTVVSAHSTVGAAKERGLSTSTSNVIQKNRTSSLSEEG